MNLSQDQLKAFYEVSRQQSFTKAAFELGLTQSALSHRIRKLEEQLETTVLVRDPAGLRLTEAGVKLLEFCRMQSQFEAEFLADIVGSASKEIKGHLRMGGASTLLWSAVVPALSEFLNQNSGVQFEFMEREMRDLPELLQNGGVDFIVTCEKVDNPHFEGHFLGNEINVLIEPKKASSKLEVYLDHDSKDQTTLNFLKFQGTRKTKIKRGFMDNITGIISGVEAGLGKAVVPLHLVKGLKNIKIDVSAKPQKEAAYLYVLKQPFYPKLHSAVVRELTENIKLYLPEE